MVLITENPSRLGIGDPVPAFSVADISGRPWDAATLRTRGRAGALVGFTCNHCPYVQAYEDRLIRLTHEFAPRGFAFLMINPNAANAGYAEDSEAKMRERAEARKFPFFYAADRSQEAARAFGAACTPEFYLFDAQGLLAYTGRIDDEMEESKVRRSWLKEALDAVATGSTPPVNASHPIGCSIKWL